MNNEGRKNISEIFEDLNLTQQTILAMGLGEKSRSEEVLDRIESAQDSLQEVIDEEQEKFDNMPEGLQSGGRGESMREVITTLEGVIEELNDIHGYNSEEGTEEEWIEGVLSDIEDARTSAMEV